MEIAAVVFVLVTLLVAYIAFRVLKRTVKMAIRALIVFILIGVALIGGTALWFVGNGESSSKPPTKSR